MFVFLFAIGEIGETIAKIRAGVARRFQKPRELQSRSRRWWAKGGRIVSIRCDSLRFVSNCFQLFPIVSTFVSTVGEKNARETIAFRIAHYDPSRNPRTISREGAK
jgi:hypothetical protein